jgi:glucose/arabinose dehydrogenase
LLPGVVLAALVLSGCSGAQDGPDGADRGSSTGTPSTTSSSGDSSSAAPSSNVARPRLAGTVATDLEVPWGMAFLPDGSALVAERDTERVKQVTADGQVRTVGAVEGVDGVGEGGLLGLAVSPDFAEDSAVFAYFTKGSQNVIARLTFDGDRLSGQQRIFDGIPSGPIHNGGRIAFGPDGYLYVGTGESGDTDLAQRKDSLGGKILRITADGEPAPDNPFPGSPVYSLGHRNVQGLAWDSRGQLWAAEFGQNTWDELNRIEPGKNYGWPDVEGRAGEDGYVDPVRQWRTSVASPSGIAIAEDSVFMAGLRGARLWQVPIPGGRAGRPAALLRERFGRLRTVVAAPDGSLWVTTSNRDGRGSPRSGDDKILRLTFDG